MEVLRSIWLFIQDQVLGMKWLNAVINNGLSALGLDTYNLTFPVPQSFEG